MNDFTTTFLNRLKGITLSSNERLAMRERLVLYTDMHIASEALQTSSAYSGIFSFIMSRRFPAYALGLMLVVTLGGGVTLAADTSAPGDALYALKIHINEPVMTALAPTASGQAKVAAELATRRVDEAVTLASRGTLTTDRQTYLATEFAVRIKNAAKKADELASTGDTAGAETIKANLAANLAGEAQALGAVTTNDSEESAGLLRIVVATSQDIANTTSVTDAILASSNDTGNGSATSTEPSAVRTMAAMTKNASTSSSTPNAVRARTTVRIPRDLHLTASTTFRGHLFTSSNAFTSKTDVAIPHTAASQSDINRTQMLDGSSSLTQ